MKIPMGILIVGMLIFWLLLDVNSASASPVSESAGNAPLPRNTAAAPEAPLNDENQNGDSVPASRSEAEASKNGSNLLVAYFSLAGEQYGVGVIEEGNTRIIARMIAEQTGADLFEIEAVIPYPVTYSGLLDVSRQEKAENLRPEISGTVENMADYDTIFIGYPNWWGDLPMIVYNFLESYDLSGKTIVPFCTHGGSGLSGTERTIENITRATMKSGFAIAGATAQNHRDAARKEVTEWLRKGGYVK